MEASLHPEMSLQIIISQFNTLHHPITQGTSSNPCCLNVGCLMSQQINIVFLLIHRVVKDQPKPWQLAWLVSTLPTIVGLLSLPKNNTKQLYLYAFGTLVIGVGPLVYGACIMIQEIFFNIRQGRAPATQEWQSAPMKMAVSAFLIQFHGISLYYANKLISAWSSKGEKKTS